MSGEPGGRSPLKRALLAIERLEARLAAMERAAHEPIAIVGLGCRFPGGIADPEALWAKTVAGVDLITERPPGRRPVAVPGHEGTRWGGFLAEVDRFDAAFFSVAPREAASLDPQHRLLLEVAWESLERANLPADQLEGTRTGVFVGLMGNDYRDYYPPDPAARDAYHATGSYAAFAAGRLSYALGLQGPCMTLDTACSSSLVALHLACQSLRAGECDVALAGGVNLILSPSSMHASAKTNALSLDGRCYPFDARANGFARAEGCGVAVLVRLADAVAAGHDIAALVRGSAVNQDGRSTGLTAPNALAQQAVLQQALTLAQVPAASIGFVEAHGTGTALGDPLEIEALRAVIGGARPNGDSCWVGTIKGAMGHAEGAAGIAGLIRAVQAIRHRTIPPQVRFQTLNPRIRLAGSALAIAEQARQWQASEGPLRAGVSSFGMSGTNAHVVLEEAPPRDRAETTAPSPLVLPLSARSDGALWDLAAAYAEVLMRQGVDLGAVARTAALGRSHHRHRAVFTGAQPSDFIAHLQSLARGEAPAGEEGAGTGSPYAARYLAGEVIDWSSLYRGSGGLVDVPTYPWQRSRFWEAPLPEQAARGSHPLLGPHQRSSVEPDTHSWETIVSPANMPFLADHRVRDVPVVPAAALVEMIRAAGEQALQADVEVHALGLSEPLVVESPRRVQVVLQMAGASGDVRVSSLRQGQWLRHAVASVHPLASEPAAVEAIGAIRARCAHAETASAAYARFERRGLGFGRSFRRLEQLWHGDDEALAPLGLDRDSADYVLHPTLLDAALQVLAARLLAVHPGTLVIRRIGAVLVHGLPRDAVWSHATVTGALRGDVVLRDASGAALVELRGVEVAKVASAHAPLLQMVYRQSPPPPVEGAPGRWCLVGGPQASVLAEGLRDSGASLTDDRAQATDVVYAPSLGGTPQAVCAELVELVRGVLGDDTRHASRLWVVTEAVTADDPNLGHAPLLGLCRTLAVEHPGLRCRRVDACGAPVADVVAELLGGGDEDEVRLDGRRSVARLEWVEVEVPEARLVLRADASYLITGGLGGLGLALADRCVARGARHLVLLCRSGADTEDKRLALAALTERASVVVAEVDVADAEALKAALAAITPPLAGVFHAAGVRDDAPLSSLTIDQIRRVMSAKVDGAWNLHRLTADLDLFVLYGSAAALLGSPGQGHYAAANAYLGALARWRQAREQPALCVDWGLFAGVGMADDQASSRLAANGLGALEAGAGLDLLERLLGAGLTHVGAVPLRVRQWVSSYPQLAASRVWSDLTEAVAEVELAPVDLTALQVADQATRTRALERLIAEELAQVLRLPAAAIDRDAELFDLGVDSLMALELRNRLEARLGLTLPAAVALSYPTTAELADEIGARVVHASRPSSVARPARATPTAPLGRQAIAVVGIGCRFPGGGSDPDALWQRLVEGVDAVGAISAERFVAPGSLPAARWAALLDDVDHFDAAFFSISPREAQSLDPQQRLLLEVTWEALEDAALDPTKLEGTKTGVFVGVMGADHREAVNAAPLVGLNAYAATGSHNAFAAGRVSYVFGLQGPSLTVDTACSSSLVATHLAVQSLRSGECDVAIVAGVNLILSAQTMALTARLAALSVDGRCRPFDAEANGYVRGEGCGVVVLRRASDAEAAGDRIWAEIRGSAMNHDGRTAGLTVPSVRSQQAVLRAALLDGGVAPSAVGYVEAHGTGTALGDPIEVQALAEVFGQGEVPCTIGSLKANLGHTEGAAGIAGLIKAVLAVRRDVLPPQRGFEVLNPRIELQGTRLRIIDAPRSWPAAAERIAGVSSFGLSGTNAHVVIAAAAAVQRPDPRREARPLLLPVSARSPLACAALASRLADRLSATSLVTQPEDLAATQSRRRAHHRHRMAVVGADRRALIEALRAAAAGQAHPGLFCAEVADGPPPKVVFVFPGQGAQWPGMGRELLDAEPTFAAVIDELEPLIAPHVGGSLRRLLTEDHAALDRIELVQPALFAMQVALAALWRQFGVTPDAVIGHSMGEVAAACVAGALSLADGAQIICRRSSLLTTIRGNGAMAAVELSAADAATEIAPYAGQVVVAGENGPRSTILSGDPTALQTILTRLKAQAVFGRLVQVDVASHSPQVQPLVAQMRAALAGVRPRRADVPMFSTVHAAYVDGAALDAGYWVDNLTRPVRFAAGVAALAEAHRWFVEVSPHPVLAPAFAPQLPDGALVVGSLRRDEHAKTAMLDAVAALHVHGRSIRFDALYPDPLQVADLPQYPWQREHFPRALASGRSGGVGRVHPLLDDAIESSVHPGTWIWNTEIGPEDFDWLGAHRVSGAVVLPVAALIEMLLAAASARDDGASQGRLRIGELRLLRAVVFDGAARTLQVVLTSEGTFAISSRGVSAEWTLHATAKLLHGPASDAPRPSERPDLPTVTQIERRALYAELAAVGLEYGTPLQLAEVTHRAVDSAVGRVAVPADAGAYRLHPALLDACLHLVAAAFVEPLDRAWVPSALAEVRTLDGGAGDFVECRVELVEVGASEVVADVELTGDGGAPLAQLRGLTLVPLSAAAKLQSVIVRQWVRAEVDTPSPVAGRWLLVDDHTGVAGALARALRDAGATVQRAPDYAAAVVEGFDHVVFLVGLDADDPASAVASCVALVDLVQAILRAGLRDPPRLSVVTRGAQSVAGDGASGAFQAPLWGLGLGLAHEHPELRTRRVDLAPAPSDGDMVALAQALATADAEDQVALRQSGRMVARLVRRDLAPVAGARRQRRDGRPFAVYAEQPGRLDRIAASALERRAPGPGEVEVEVEAAGLNFIDVLMAMGVYPGREAELGVAVRLGGEHAGRVVAIGPDVSHVALGQRVIGLAPGSIASHVVVHATQVAAWPEALGAADAATLPTVWMTAWYALHDIGRITAGQRVLVHSASGGTGLAAIHLARRAGAEVLATAGTPAKRDFLRGLGIAHVFDSRANDFADGVLAATDGSGVDLVLNSLSGAGVEEGFRALAVDGHFLELTKRDIYGDRALNMAVFKRRISYSAIDLFGLARDRPARFGALLQDVLTAVGRGEVARLPVEVFGASRTAAAFHKMAAAEHIGKLAISIADPRLTVAAPASAVHASATYLITGGLGGLGLSAARWLAQRGAGSLLLAGRTGAVEPRQVDALAALRATGVQVRVLAVDVADADALSSALDAVALDLPPVRGVIHAAGVLDDGMLADLDPERLERVLAPKLAGAWNLHQRFADVDFFVLYSSAVSLLGSPGQAAYAAGNAFCDALAHQRRALGLPGQSINWGSFSEVGLAVDAVARLAARGVASMTPDQGVAILEQVLASDEAQVAPLAVDVRQWSEFYPLVARLPFVQSLHATTTANGGRAFLGALEAEDPAGRRRRLQARICEHLALTLRVDPSSIAARTPLQRLGVDSLMGLELRNRLEADLGLALSATIVWTHPDVERLATYLLDKLGLATGAPPSGDEGALSELSDEALAALGEDLLS